MTDTSTTVLSTVPARLDRLPWSPFHTRLVVALGACWVLNGFEIAVASNIGPLLATTARFGLSPTVIGLMATAYLLGEVVGALLFGMLSDKLGRRRLFVWTLAVYFAGSALTAVVVGSGSVAIGLLLATRVIAGAGIGGEYAAINSAIDELVPPAYRGRVGIVVNGVYWAGAALAAAVQIPLLSGAIDPGWDWRIALLVGPVLAVGIWFLRRNLPESPRWQIMRGRQDAAEASIAAIEREVDPTSRTLRPVDDRSAIPIRPTPVDSYRGTLRLLVRLYPRRCILGATLMISQSFLYNAVFFSYGMVLVRYFDVEPSRTAVYLIPFAIGNLLGPLVLGHLFDRIGRRKMISRCYGLAGGLLALSAVVFGLGGFTAVTQTLAWCVVFFFASAGASAGYLTVSEIFPMEVRAKSIAMAFAIAQLAGSIAPLCYGVLIDTAEPNRISLSTALLVGALFMTAGAFVARRMAVDAERRPLETVAPPVGVRAAGGEPLPGTTTPAHDTGATR